MPDLASLVDRLTYEDGGFVFMRPCLDVTLYWSGSMFERSDDILQFYRQSVEIIGPRLRYYRTETMGGARPLRRHTLDLVPFWLERTRSRRDVYMLFLESGERPDEPSERAFALNATPARGYVRLVLPTSAIARSVDPYLALVKNLGSMTACDFGHAGFAVHWNHLGRKVRGVLRTMNALGNRYPGVDMSYPFCTKYIAPKGIKCVNWLTLVKHADCERLGGVAALRNQFDERVLIHEAKNGIIIQAGPAPEIGDVNRLQDLPVYRQVGRGLAPIRCRDHPPLFGPDGLADREATEKWLSRFDS